MSHNSNSKSYAAALYGCQRTAEHSIMDPSGGRPLAAAALMFPPAVATAAAPHWLNPSSYPYYLEEFYKQYHGATACSSPGIASHHHVGSPAAAAAAAACSSHSLHGAPTYIASPGSPLPPAFSFLNSPPTPTGLLQPPQQQQHHRHSSSSQQQQLADAAVQCCLPTADAATQTAAAGCSYGGAASDQEEVDYEAEYDDNDEEEYDDDAGDGDISNDDDDDAEEAADRKGLEHQHQLPHQHQQDKKCLVFGGGAPQNANATSATAAAAAATAAAGATTQGRKIGIVRGRLRSEEQQQQQQLQQDANDDEASGASRQQEVSMADGDGTADSGDVPTASPLCYRQRQLDTLCAVASLLQRQVELDEADDDVNSVDNLGCRYDIRPVGPVDLRQGAQLLPAGKDCEQLVARIEALWRRIQQSRRRHRQQQHQQQQQQRSRRLRHRSAAAVASSSPASAAAAAAADDSGESFSPYSSSINMLAFCASEQRQLKRKQQQQQQQQQDSGACPTIDRIPADGQHCSAAGGGSTTTTTIRRAASMDDKKAPSSSPAAALPEHRRHHQQQPSPPRKRRCRLSSSQSQSLSESQPPPDVPSAAGNNNSRPPTPELRSCQLAEGDLRDGQRVLVTDGAGLWRPSVLRAVRPPDVYAVTPAGPGRSRYQYLSREELLGQAVLEIRPSCRAELPPGARVCAYWSASLSAALYPGTVVDPSASGGAGVGEDDDEASRNDGEEDEDEEEEEDAEGDDGAHSAHSASRRQAEVCVLFDDNDRRSVSLDRIRMLLPAAASGAAVASSTAAAAAAAAHHPRASASSAASFEWADKGRRRGRRCLHRTLLRNGEPISVGDAVMFKSGSAADSPFYGRVLAMWEDQPAEHQHHQHQASEASRRPRMWVEAAWFYQPAEMAPSAGRRFLRDNGRALFLSGHRDANEARTILRKLRLRARYDDEAEEEELELDDSDEQEGGSCFFLAGEYDAVAGRVTRLDPSYAAALAARRKKRKEKKEKKKTKNKRKMTKMEVDDDEDEVEEAAAMIEDAACRPDDCNHDGEDDAESVATA